MEIPRELKSAVPATVEIRKLGPSHWCLFSGKNHLACVDESVQFANLLVHLLKEAAVQIGEENQEIGHQA